jgi:hypothetical protein
MDTYNSMAKASAPRPAAVSDETRQWLRRCKVADLFLRATSSWTFLERDLRRVEIAEGRTRVSPDSKIAARWPDRFAAETRPTRSIDDGPQD